ncbi:hypothetical protein Cgig2_018262 [Carnegiea gigantea]|uniref:Pyrrolidone-carboxylate peptidase n=1 Tax=Carnegiea gigantea TaxID=171969 RepID=A0A9Q1KXZ5_9CARY|nr:hypothetical protein Cgig2_018262 [Carnegiea gigantea]
MKWASDSLALRVSNVLGSIGNCIAVCNEDMGSEGPKTVTIHVTGFKKFQGVSENPTETIVNNLSDYIIKKGLPAGVTLGSCTVLETAGEGARPALYKTFEAAATNENSGSVVWLYHNTFRLFDSLESSLLNLEVPGNQPSGVNGAMLHLGVNGGAKKFAIERQAFNEATFCCPDELGWQPLVDSLLFVCLSLLLLIPFSSVLILIYSLLAFSSFQKQPIVLDDGETTKTRQTQCSAESICDLLKKKGFDVTLSDNAGRFVCNYVYYHSLRFAEERGHKSLFVHVPLFSKIDEETQMQFVVALLEAISATC